MLAQIVLYRIQAGLVYLYPPKANKTNDPAKETGRANVAVQQKKLAGQMMQCSKTKSRANDAVQHKQIAGQMLQCNKNVRRAKCCNAATKEKQVKKEMLQCNLLRQATKKLQRKTTKTAK